MSVFSLKYEQHTLECADIDILLQINYWMPYIDALTPRVCAVRLTNAAGERPTPVKSETTQIPSQRPHTINPLILASVSLDNCQNDKANQEGRHCRKVSDNTTALRWNVMLISTSRYGTRYAPLSSHDSFHLYSTLQRFTPRLDLN